MENKCIFSLETHQVEQILATMADKIAELESFLRYKDERHAADAVEKAALMDENRRLHELHEKMESIRERAAEDIVSVRKEGISHE